MRAFLAVHFSEGVVRRIVRLQELLSEPMRRHGFRPTRENHIHLTLAFMADLEPARATGLRVSLAEALQEFPAPILKFGSVSPLGKSGSRVLIVDVVSTPELMQLSQTVRAVLDRSGVEYDRKPFRGHVTMGRSKEEVSRSAWEASVHGFGLPGIPDGLAESVELVGSELTQTGPKYRELFSVRLA